MSLSKCQPLGALKSSNKTTVSFDVRTGMAHFSNFYINDTGMYIVLINVRTLSGSESLTCYSEPVVAKSAFTTATIDTSSQPNLNVNYSGDYSQLTANEKKQMKAIFYNCVVSPHALVTDDTVHIYKGSIMFSVYYSTSITTTQQTALSTYFQSSTFLSLFPSLSLNSVIMDGYTVVSYSSKGDSSNSGTSNNNDVVVVVADSNNKTVAVVVKKENSSDDSVDKN